MRPTLAARPPPAIPGAAGLYLLTHYLDYAERAPSIERARRGARTRPLAWPASRSRSRLPPTGRTGWSRPTPPPLGPSASVNSTHRPLLSRNAHRSPPDRDGPWARITALPWQGLGDAAQPQGRAGQRIAAVVDRGQHHPSTCSRCPSRCQRCSRAPSLPVPGDVTAVGGRRPRRTSSRSRAGDASSSPSGLNARISGETGWVSPSTDGNDRAACG